MTKAVIFAGAALLAATASVSAGTYVVDRWPGDVNSIPCSAWTRTDDGTWVLNGKLKIGASEIEDIGVKGDAAARSLQKRCGK